MTTNQADIIGGFPFVDPLCAGCGKELLIENAWMADGCPCNHPLGINNQNETRWRLLMMLQQRQQHQVERLKAQLDPAICRLQLPDGTVPTDIENCAQGWKRAYEAVRELGNRQSREIENLRDMADAVGVLRDIGSVFGCDHVDDPDGRRQLVNCIEQEFQRVNNERDGEAAIVDRVWKALGISAMAEANGKAIDQIVREIRNQLYRVKDVLAFYHGNNGEKLEAIRRAVPAILCGEPDLSDAAETVTEEWLRSVGFQIAAPFGDHVCGALHRGIDRKGNVYWCVRSLPIPDPKTRGNVRALCSLLGIELTTKADPVTAS